MASTSKSKIHLVLRNSDGLSGTPRILRRQAKLLQDLSQVSVISESFHSDLLTNPKIRCQKVYKWPKNTLFQRRFFDWQAQRKIKNAGSQLVIGNGDTLHQDLLFMHVCVHKGAELYPEKYKKNLSVPFHKMIFEQGSFKTLVCVSKMMRDDLVSRYQINKPTYILRPGYEAKIHDSINQDAIKEIRNAVTKGEDKIVLGVITSGDLLNRGAFALIRAVGKLSAELQNKVAILIVGKEGHPEKLFNLAKEVGLKCNVHWSKPREDVANLFLATDIVIHAAQMEAFGMSVLEAMVLGLPLITTETVGCSELFSSEQQEFVIPKQDDEMIAEKLKVLINSKELCQKLGSLNTAIGSQYTWEKYDQGFMEIISKEFPKLITPESVIFSGP